MVLRYIGNIEIDDDDDDECIGPTLGNRSRVVTRIVKFSMKKICETFTVFFIVRRYYNYTYLSEFQKKIISRRPIGAFLLSIT